MCRSTSTKPTFGAGRPEPRSGCSRQTILGAIVTTLTLLSQYPASGASQSDHGGSLPGSEATATAWSREPAGATSEAVTDSFVTTGGVYLGISFQARPADARVSSVFDELGSYDPTRWRLFRWVPGERYEEMSHDGDTIEVGRGYWLITRDAQTVRSPGTTLDVDTLAIPLSHGFGTYSGWNLVGNPYGFAVSTNQLRIAKRDSIRDFGEVFTEPGAWVWSPSTLQHDARLSIPPNAAFWVRLTDVAPDPAWTFWPTPVTSQLAADAWLRPPGIPVALDSAGSPAVLDLAKSGVTLWRRRGLAWVKSQLFDEWDPASGPNPGAPHSLAFDGQGRPHVVFIRNVNSRPQLAPDAFHCLFDACQASYLGPGEPYSFCFYAVEGLTSLDLSLDSSDAPRILAHYDNRAADPPVPSTPYRLALNFGRFPSPSSYLCAESTLCTNCPGPARLAVGPDGAVHVIYVGQQAGESVISWSAVGSTGWGQRFLDGSSSDPPYVALGDVTIAIAPSGRPCVVWSTSRGVRYGEMRSDSTWLVEEVVGAAAMASVSLTLAPSGAKHLLMVDPVTRTVSYATRGASQWMIQGVSLPASFRWIGRLYVDHLGQPSFAYADSVTGRIHIAEKKSGTVLLQVPRPMAVAATNPESATVPGGGWGLTITGHPGQPPATPLQLWAVPPGTPATSAQSLSRPPLLPRNQISVCVVDEQRGPLARVVQTEADSMVWSIELLADSGPQEITLRLEGDDLPTDLNVRVSDRSVDWQRDWRVGESMSFAVSGSPRRISLVARRGSQGPTTARRTGLQNVYPNPTPRGTSFLFVTNGLTVARVDLFDVGGRHVRGLEETWTVAGEHLIEWDGRNHRGQEALPGIYFARFRLGDTGGVARVVRLPRP